MSRPSTSTALAPPKVLAAAASGVVQHIARNGGDPDRIFGRATIRTRDLDSPFNELDLNQYCLLFEEAAQQTGNDNFGLQFGNEFTPRRLGAIGYAAISSPTLSAALRNMERYFAAHQSQTTFSLRQDRDLLWLVYQIYDPRITRRRQDAELSIGMFCNLFRHCLGDTWAPLEVRFEHAAPAQPREHETCYGAPVSFGRGLNAMAFRRSDLDRAMPEQDPYLFSIIEAFLKNRCELRADPCDFASLVRNQIKLSLEGATPTLCEVARDLGVSEQHFRRQLREQHLGFNDLLKAARQELALKLVQESDMPLTQAAFALGYSELSAFSRAFRVWTGMSPQRYRRLHQQGG